MNIDDTKKKMPCSLYKLFCIINQIQCSESVDPWYGQIKELADGANKWAPEMYEAVVFGMYPELEVASKEFYRRYKDIYRKCENNPNKDNKALTQQLKMLSLQIGKEYSLREGYCFNKQTDEQLQRVMGRKSLAMKDECYKAAEALCDPLHMVMQGMTEKLTSSECNGLILNFSLAERFFKCEKENDVERIEFGKKKFPESYSIYRQVKKSLETAQIKDCYQKIDDKNYKQFIQTLGDFEYKGKKYKLLNVVRPITQKRDLLGRITENRTVLTESTKKLGRM